MIKNKYLIHKDYCEIQITSKILGVKCVKIDIEMVPHVQHIHWSLSEITSRNKYPYAIAFHNNKKIRMHRLILELKYGKSSMAIDHINRDGLDNRASNLRYCSDSINSINKNTYKNNHLNAKGVQKRTYKNGKVSYRARGRYLGVLYNLGEFQTLEEAKKARDSWEYSFI